MRLVAWVAWAGWLGGIGCVAVGCGPSVALGDGTTSGSTTSEPATTAPLTTTPVTTTTGADEDTATTDPPPPTSTDGTGDESTSTTDDCDRDEGGDTEDLGECDPDALGSEGRIAISDPDDDFASIDVDALCDVVDVSSGDPTEVIADLSCPDGDLQLQLHTDPPLVLASPLTAGETIRLRAFRDVYIDTPAPHHVVIRDPDDTLRAAYHGTIPVSSEDAPDYLAWFAPITFAEVSLDCPAIDPDEPSAGCSFITDPCSTAKEVRAVDFDDGTDQIQLAHGGSGSLGVLEIRVDAALQLLPTPEDQCYDQPFSRIEWAAFAVQ